MKTLDEVIKAYEYCIDNNYRDCRGCPYGCEDGESGCHDAEEKNDALHYLKEYQKIGDEYHELKDWWAEEYVTNAPLTWDELKQMEGKPVWVEVYDPIDEKTGWHTASWKLIEFINDEYFDVRNSDGEQECFYKSENDCYCWQAYRKERK